MDLSRENKYLAYVTFFIIKKQRFEHRLTYPLLDKFKAIRENSETKIKDCLMQNRTEDYQSRINRVMDYIEDNLSKEFTLDELAMAAHFSKFHFHRIFYSMTGETLFQFILRLRLEKAAGRLCTEPASSITEIAMDCGFSSSAGFARRFKEHFNLSATDWRRKNSNLSQTNSNYGKDKTRIKRYNYPDETGLNDVQVTRFPGLTAAYIRYTGPYKGDEQLFLNLFERLSGGRPPGESPHCRTQKHW